MTTDYWNPRNCTLCNGPLTFLGALGWSRWFRCRDCADVAYYPARPPLNPRKDRTMNKYIVKDTITLERKFSVWAKDERDAINEVSDGRGTLVEEVQIDATNWEIQVSPPD